jgi:zinc transport system ATP-binding protein
VEKLIKLKNVSVKFGDYDVLKDVNFSLDKGEFLNVVGPNGSGKTTLVKVISGLIKPNHGSLTHKCRQMGYLPQKMVNRSEFPITVKEVIEGGNLVAIKTDKLAYQESLNKWLEKMEIKHLINRSMQRLSGGQQQRVYLVRALVSNPELLILDEPTSALDPTFRSKFQKILFDLHKKDKKTIINITHDLDDVVDLNSKVLYIDQTVKFFGSVKSYRKKFGLKEHHHD